MVECLETITARTLVEQLLTLTSEYRRQLVKNFIGKNTIWDKFTKKIQQDATLYQNFISYLYEAQHVAGDTPLIIRSLKLHYQPLVLHNTVEGCWTCSCWTLSKYTIPDSVQMLVQF
jgi:hypothetical protein